MFVSLVLILLLTVGGLSLTYLFAEDGSFLWRVCAGNVAGSTIFGLVCFLLACIFGFTIATILLSFLITLSPLLVFSRKTNRAALQNDWKKARGKFENTTFKRILRFAYYAFFLVLFYFFFDRVMLETAQGIFTGGSQNLGDLPFHLGAIYSFTDGGNFPPENPSYAFAKFSYPFIADLITASFVKFGASARNAMLVQNVALAFSLLVVLERFSFKLTGSKLAGKIAPVLLFFSGGLGFFWFAKDYWVGTESFFKFIWNLPRDYTISDKFRWGNSLVTIFITQRSLLLGMPLTIIVLQKLWETFSNVECGVRNAELKTVVQTSNKKRITINNQLDIPHSAFRTPHFIIGLLAGTLPLVHVHSLAVLFVVSAFLFFLRLNKWREWTTFAIGVAIVAIPELVWVMTGSATRLTEFVGWNFGWDKGNDNFLWFWLKNAGAFIPILLFGIYFIYQSRTSERREETKEKRKRESDFEIEQSPIANRQSLILLFYLPLALCFVVSNVIKLAPWQWDNIKVLIYWFVGSLPIVALVLARLWAKDALYKIIAVGSLIVLTFSGALDVWRTASKQINYKVFDKDAVAVAEQIKGKTAPNALFLNAPTYNSAVVLSGRRSLMRYSGHLSSYGIDYGEREADVKRIYAGDATADIFLKKYGIEYIVVSPEERANLTVNEEFFRRFPVFAEAGQYRVYQIKK